MKLITKLVAVFGAAALGGYLYYESRLPRSVKAMDNAQPAVYSKQFPTGSIRIEVVDGKDVTYQGVVRGDTVAVQAPDGSFHFNDLCHGGAEVAAKGNAVRFSTTGISCPIPSAR